MLTSGLAIQEMMNDDNRCFNRTCKSSTCKYNKPKS